MQAKVMLLFLLIVTVIAGFVPTNPFPFLFFFLAGIEASMLCSWLTEK